MLLVSFAFILGVSFRPAFVLEFRTAGHVKSENFSSWHNRTDPHDSDTVSSTERSSIRTFLKRTSLELHPYCVIQITTPHSAQSREAASFVSLNGAQATRWTHVNSKGMHQDVMFDALTEALDNGCKGDWFFMGDDDTMFFHSGIVEFLSNRRKQAKLAFAHGNLWSAQDIASSWYTGGSGLVLTRISTELVTSRYRSAAVQSVVRKSFDSCNCFDVPFTKALHTVGVRLMHSPDFFLDSCLDCQQRLLSDIPVVSCHGVTVFRERAVHSLNKGVDKFAQVDPHPNYSQPSFFANMTFDERVQHFNKRCSQD